MKAFLQVYSCTIWKQPSFIFFAILLLYFQVYGWMGGPSRNLTTFLAFRYCYFYFIPFFFILDYDCTIFQWIWRLCLSFLLPFILLLLPGLWLNHLAVNFISKLSPRQPRLLTSDLQLVTFWQERLCIAGNRFTCDHPWPLLLAGNHLLRFLLLPSGGNFMTALNPPASQ